MLTLVLICLLPFQVLSDIPKCTKKCKTSLTEVSGKFAPSSFCSKDLIFEDNFDDFNLEIWKHESTLSGGGNWEFQWYSNNRTNSFTENGILYLRPSLLADQFGEDFLSSGTLTADGCTQSQFFGCERVGTPSNILNPIKSAKVRTTESFSFKYGRLEVRAKMPSGDWLWPAIWLMPTYDQYGTWPSSGEIDVAESRGNKNLLDSSGVNIGTEQVSSTLHYGPAPTMNRWDLAQWKRNDVAGFENAFHRYQLEWTPDHITFSIDDVITGTITPPAGGMWEYGNFSSYNVENPWRYGTKFAPFDQKFYLILNLAVGGTTGFMSDDISNPTPKPWSNDSPTALTDFWNGKCDWLPTWNLDKDDGHSASLQVDYVRIWAL